MTSFPSLVSTAWLAEHLHDENVRILDATVRMPIQNNKESTYSGGIEDYQRAHIPGAQFADLRSELSESNSEFYFTLPSEQQFAQAMGRLGVSNDSNIVIYCGGYSGWSTRLWWLLKTFGHDRVAVLDGGLKKWQHEQRPLSSGVEPLTEQTFIARLNREYVANKDSVHSAITKESDNCCVIDSLPAAYFRGEAGDTYGYGRLGHITGAVNVPTDELINPETGEFLPIEILQEKFSSVLNAQSKTLITYCGGGIAATQNAFVLHLLGRSDVAVYDASLQEWTKDESLPMTL